MLRTVKVYGAWQSTAVRACLRQWCACQPTRSSFCCATFLSCGLDAGWYYKVAVGPHDLQLADCPEQLGYPLAVDDVVQVIPVVSGAGGGLEKVLAGAALIAAAVVLAPTGGGGFLGATGTGFFSAGVSAAVGNIGLSLALGGVAQMISPQPPAPPEFDNDPRNNYGFSGIQQTAREGSTIPVVYGETLVGSIIISQGLNVDEVA